MKTRQFPLLMLLLTAILLTACGPSPEQVATMTASAWTPTPVPPTITPSPTPLPYDLTVKVTDADGNLIAGASVIFPESGNDEPVAVDASGQTAWNNLKGPNVSLTVTAQGYFKGEQSLSLERGPNEVNVKLERDPFGILPSEACGAGESLLYVEDYQDGEAQDWRADQSNPDAVYVGPATDNAANSVWTIDATKITNYDNAWLGANYANGNQGSDPGLFGDAVWRMRFMVSRPTMPRLNWHELAMPGGSKYDFILSGGQSQVHLMRYLMDATGGISSEQTAKSDGFKQLPMTWHYIEVSTFQGNVQLWIDGQPVIDFTDPEPLPAGGIGIWIGAFTDKSITVLYFDDIRVCGLSAPFTSTFVAP